MLKYISNHEDIFVCALFSAVKRLIPSKIVCVLCIFIMHIYIYIYIFKKNIVCSYIKCIF